MKCCLCGRAGGVSKWLFVDGYASGKPDRNACSKECWDVERAAILLKQDGESVPTPSTRAQP